MVTAYGWRTSVAFFGILIAAVGVMSFVLIGRERQPDHRRAPGEPETHGIGRKLVYLARSPVFLLIGSAYVICGFTTTGVIKVHLIPYASLCGFDLTTGAAAIGIVAGFDMVGMIISGYLTDRLNRPMLLGCVYFLRALTFVMLFFVTDNIVLLFAFAVLFGTLDFATVPPTAGLIASHLGVGTMGFNMGILFAGHSLGGAIGALLAGQLYDWSARYDWVWIIALGLALVAAVLAWCVPEKRETAPAAVAAA